MSELNARKLDAGLPEEDARDLENAMRDWANAADSDRREVADAVKDWAAAVQHPANDEDAQALLPGPSVERPDIHAGALGGGVMMASLGAASALSSAATKDPKNKPKSANPYLTPKLGGAAGTADTGEATDPSELRVIPSPDAEPAADQEPAGIMRPVILSGAAALAASELTEPKAESPQPEPVSQPVTEHVTEPEYDPEHDQDDARYNQVVNESGEHVSPREYYSDADPVLAEDDDDRSLVMKALPFAALAAIGVSFLGVMAVQGQGKLIVPETPKVYAPTVPLASDFLPERVPETAIIPPVNPVPTPVVDTPAPAVEEPALLTPEPEIIAAPIPDPEPVATEGEPDVGSGADLPADTPVAATEPPPPPPTEPVSEPVTAIVPVTDAPREEPETPDEPVQMAKVDIVPEPAPKPVAPAPAPTPAPAPVRTVSTRFDARGGLPAPSLKPALASAKPSYYVTPRKARVARVDPRPAPRPLPAPTQGTVGSDGTVSDLIYRTASTTTSDSNFPDYWAGLSWMVGDTLGDAIDGEARSIKAPDGRRFTLLPTGTRREMRTMTAMRADELGQLPEGLSAKRGLMQTLRDTSLYAAPNASGDGDVIDLIRGGTPIQQIATLDQSAVDAWSLVGRYGIAFGFLKLSDLERAGSVSHDSIYNRVHGPVRQDVVRVRTYCRDAVWEIGTEQGQLSACMAPNGKWLIEQQTSTGLDTVPSSTAVAYE